MLWILTTRAFRNTVEELRAFMGGEFRSRVRSLPYPALGRLRALPGGAYLFADLERLDPREFQLAARVAARVAEAAPDAVVLNDPRRANRRFELLRRLHREGVNSFDVYRADAPCSPGRWPVFLRGEQDHDGAATELLQGPADLAAALSAERESGLDASRRLIVEFADTKAADGLYRKYGVFRVGDRIIPRHVHFGKHWMVKLQEPPSLDAIDEERAFVESGRDDAMVRGIFDRAGIQYGRIDYSRNGAGIEVWEINTNPAVVDRRTIEMTSRWPMNREVIPRVAEALLELARGGAGRPRIPLGGLRGVRPAWWRC